MFVYFFVNALAPETSNFHQGNYSFFTTDYADACKYSVQHAI